MFLTKPELIRLTGYCQSRKQIAALDSKRIKHTTDAYGRPLVLRAAVEQMLQHNSGAPTGEPDFTYFQSA
jgi:hypothetical protein